MKQRSGSNNSLINPLHGIAIGSLCWGLTQLTLQPSRFYFIEKVPGSVRLYAVHKYKTCSVIVRVPTDLQQTHKQYAGQDPFRQTRSGQWSVPAECQSV